jgi:energy-coupling factor transporter ATP-binding protein EcfA2
MTIRATIGTNPFPGLRPFDGDDPDHPFFGREEQVDDLLGRLRRTRFLTIIGTSGCGKSSLVRAGLLPALHSGYMAGAGSHWRIALLRPGLEPMANLARVLSAPDVLGGAERGPVLGSSLMGAVLDRGSRGLIEAVQEAGLSDDENVLVLVDQFEELFRFVRSSSSANDSSREATSNEAIAFVRLLLEASRSAELPIYVAITMRSDFVGDCARFRDLPEQINDGMFLVPRMTRDQLRRAIEGPVRVAQAEISLALVARLLNDVGDDPDQLPVLQHALMRTWDRWAKGGDPHVPIDVEHYEAVGEMTQALSRHADEIYGSLTDDVRAVVERLFKCLTDRGSDNRGIRRPTRVADACKIVDVRSDELKNVVERFNAPGCSFLMPPSGEPLVDNTILDISHESLMRIWAQLGKWVAEEAESARIYKRLAEDAARSAALWRDPDLAVGLAWLKQNRHKINDAWAGRYAP